MKLDTKQAYFRCWKKGKQGLYVSSLVFLVGGAFAPALSVLADTDTTEATPGSSEVATSPIPPTEESSSTSAAPSETTSNESSTSVTTPSDSASESTPAAVSTTIQAASVKATPAITPVESDSNNILWTGNWGTAPVSIDDAGILTVGSGTVSGPIANIFYGKDPNNFRETVKEITLTGPVIFPADSSYLFTTWNGSYNPFPMLNSITGLSYADTSNVTNMTGMFMFLDTVTSLDVSSFNTSKVTSMYYMFGKMESLESIDISNFNTSNVNNMFCMFSQNRSLKSLDLSSFDTRNVSDMRGLLGTIKGVGGFQKITLGSNFSFSQIGDWGADLREIKDMQGYDSSKYTGYWQNIGTGTAEHPNGLHILSSDELMKSYNGNTMADTYVWQPKSSEAAPVTVKYVDEQGNTISDNVTLKGNVGDTFSTEQKTIAGYTFKEVQGNTTGTFKEAEQAVTYVYTKDPVAGGNVTAKYVDEQGNTISDNVTLKGNVGDTFSTEQKTIAGYTFKEVQGNTTGTFKEAEQAVTYVYTKDPVAGGNVTAKYVDEQGNTISDNVTLKGNVGDTFSTEQKKIDGYTFKEVQGNVTGQFTDQAQTVTYVYERTNAKDEKIIIHTPTTSNNFNHPAKSEKITKQKSYLPKTGEQKAGWLTVIGVLLIGSTVGYLYFRKKVER